MCPKKSLIMCVLLAIAAIGCTQASPAGLENAQVVLTYTSADNQTILEETFLVKKGTNAFEAMQQNTELEFESFGEGVFITSIANQPPPAGYYLALYVNGEYADKGIKDYVLNEDTVIEWKTEKIESFLG